MTLKIPTPATVKVGRDLRRNIATVKDRLESAILVEHKNIKTLLVYLLKVSGLFHSRDAKLYVSGGFADLCSV